MSQLIKKEPPEKTKTFLYGSKKVWVWTHVNLVIFFLIISFILSLFIGSVLFVFISLDIPNIHSLASYRPSTTSVIYDDRGQTIARMFKQNRSIIPLNRLPDLLPKAFIAAEDARFYEHRGVDALSILRAFVHNMKSGDRGQGGSTITQQVARSLLLTREKTYIRKFKEAILAYRIDNSLTKDEILHIYLNEIYLGSGAYGVEAAAQVYFGKHVWELNLAEISLLAGLPQAPSRYSPFRHYKLAKKRQVYVLNRMAADGFITPTSARKAYKKALLWRPEVKHPPENEYFIQHVKNYVERKYGRERLIGGGLQIFTTLDQPLQHAANIAIQLGITKWEIRQNTSQTGVEPPQAALIAMEVKTGKVKAVVGGTSFSQSQFNRATQAKRQPGSAFKPLIYATALANNLTPATIIIDEPLELQGANEDEIWEPKNFSGEFCGPTTLRDGLVHSRNIVTIKLLQEIGVTPTVKLAKEMGIQSPLANNLSLALGSSDISILELTGAYSVFANHGNFTKPVFITKILDRYGNILEENRPEPHRVLDELTSYQVTHLLKSVIEEGTGKSVRGLAAPAAGKTGTTDQYMDAWFVGFTPELATGVWVGFDQKKTLGNGETGGKAATPIWLDFMKKALESYPSADFIIPEGIEIIPINNETGEIGKDYSEKISWEAFKKDSLPWKDNNIPQDLSEFSPL